MIAAIYIAVICVANLLVAHFGPWITPINAFVLVGLDMVLRDILHERYGLIRSVLLSAVAGVISFAINPAAGIIAIASVVAFVAASVANDSTGSTHCYSGKNSDGTAKVCLRLPGSVLLAGWVTPTTRDWKDTSGMTAQRDGKERLDQLPRQAYTAGPLRLTVFGEMRTGSFVEMGNGVQLNPAHSRWLQGLPKTWDTESPHYEQWQAATAQADLRVTVTL
ncbi:TPA: hypothetical protein SII06_002849 [Escherichia coli]|nr:hypothetical protein [Escherichia coli]